MIQTARYWIGSIICLTISSLLQAAEPTLSPFDILDQDTLLALIISASTPVEAGKTARSLQQSKKGFAEFVATNNEKIIDALAQRFGIPKFLAAWYLGTAKAQAWADLHVQEELKKMGSVEKKELLHRVLSFFSDSPQEHEIIRRLIALGICSPLDPEVIKIQGKTMVRSTTKFDLGPVNGIQFAPITINQLNVELKLIGSLSHDNTVIYYGFSAKLNPLAETPEEQWSRDTQFVIIIVNLTTAERRVYSIPLGAPDSPSVQKRS